MDNEFGVWFGFGWCLFFCVVIVTINILMPIPEVNSFVVNSVKLVNDKVIYDVEINGSCVFHHIIEIITDSLKWNPGDTIFKVQ